MGDDTGVPEPIIMKIKNGWAALSYRWGVHGRTQEEALQKYYEAEAKHREIDERPFWHECLRQEGLQNGRD
jgi:hypothetical protein